VEHTDDGTDRYSSRVFAEAAIGCERCHGPGADHVAKMTALPAGAKADDLQIVNPVDLEPRRREAVCNQCHLGGEATIPRFGRGFYDFRPGDHLDDTLLVFVHDETATTASGAKPVSQVEQMRQSGCWKGTGGTLGCVSCHDPHSKPAPEAIDAFYRSKCQACHEEKPCSLPEVERDTAPAAGSCIRCHMPSQDLVEIAHTAMSDHRVPRKPDQSAPAAPRGQGAALVAFDDAASRVPARELERARGLVLASLPGTAKSTQRAQEAISALTPPGIDSKDQRALVAALAGDVESLRGLGQLFASTGRIHAAAACWEGALAADPADGETMSLLALQMQRGGRLREALAMLDRLVATNPFVAAIHAQRGALLVPLGRPDDAIAAVRTSLTLDPSSLPVRSFLAELLARSGHEAEAEEERTTISRLKAAAAAPYRPADVTTPPDAPPVAPSSSPPRAD
jgi:predicted CXXCH cytochrome family protein